MGRCREYIQREFGFPVETKERELVLAAGVQAEVLQNDPNRVAWVIVNLGAAIATCSFTANVSALFGLQFGANGGINSVTARDDGELPTHGMYGFSAVGTTLYILETVAVS